MDRIIPYKFYYINITGNKLTNSKIYLNKLILILYNKIQ